MIRSKPAVDRERQRGARLARLRSLLDRRGDGALAGARADDTIVVEDDVSRSVTAG